LDNQLPLGPTPPPQPRYATILRRVSLVLGLLLVGLGSTLAGFAIFEHKTPLQVVSQVTQVFVPSPQQVFGKNDVLVLVEGLDYDYDAKDQEFSKESRSDVIWAVHLDLNNKRIYQLSIPRDMIATMPNGQQAKINQAQSDGGVKEAKSVIANWLGIPGFDRYMVLRIDATKDFINALGGVNVYVKNSDCLRNHTNCTGDSINYDDSWGHLHIHLTEGMHHLNGDQAVGYMRFRHDWCSDPCRIMRQQQVLHALMDRVKGDKINTLLHVNDLLGVFHRDVDTNFTNAELVSLANYYADMDQSALKTNQVPYTSDMDLPNYGDSLVPDVTARAQLVQSMLIAPPTPLPSPDANALAGVVPSSVRVDVENGSGVRGAAHRVASELQKAGFVIADVGDAPSDDHTTTEIHDHSRVAFAGAKVRAALPALSTLTIIGDGTLPSASPLVTSQGSDVTVVVGRDLVSALSKAPSKANASP